MPLKLNAFSGGSVTLNPASTASDFTLTVPAVSGTVVTTGSSAVVTPAMLSTGAPSWNASGDLSFNSGYGSVATAYGCRAWVNFDASTGTPVVRGSGNVSSLTDFAVGQFGINFTTSMPDTNYCVHISHSHNSTATGFNIVGAVVISAAQARVGTFSGTAFADYAFNYVSVFR